MPDGAARGNARRRPVRQPPSTQHAYRTGLTYDGPEPNIFLTRDAVIDLFRDYAQRIAAPVQLGTRAPGEGYVPEGRLPRAKSVEVRWCGEAGRAEPFR
jgi:hypothetical protein